MIKTLLAADRSERERFRIPRSVQQSIPIQKIYRDRPLAAELCYSTIDCHSSHDGDNSVLFLTAVLV